MQNYKYMRMPQNDKVVERELSYELGGVFFNIQKRLGRFCREKQYADALAGELESMNIPFERECSILLDGKKSNFVDFFIAGRVFVDLKAKPFIEKGDYYQMKRYLEAANLKLGLIVNFRQRFLKPQRVLNSRFSQNSHKFAVLHRSDGFTLVDLMVAVGLFAVIATIAMGGFARALRTQQQVAALIAANNNAYLAVEEMARDLRDGYLYCSDETASACGGTFLADGSYRTSRIQFINSRFETVDYRWSGEAIERGIGGAFSKITGSNVSIRYLRFYIFGKDTSDGIPRITIVAGVSAKEAGAAASATNIQTTVASRFLDT